VPGVDSVPQQIALCLLGRGAGVRGHDIRVFLLDIVDNLVYPFLANRAPYFDTDILAIKFVIPKKTHIKVEEINLV